MTKIKEFLFSPFLLIAIIVISLITAFPQLLVRHEAEQKNKTVDILLPYEELLERVQLHGGGAISSGEALGNFREAGIGGMLLREQSVNDLRKRGELQVFEGAELLAAHRGGRGAGWVNTLGDLGEILPGRLYMEIYEEALWERAHYYLSHKYRNVSIHQAMPGPGRPGILSLPGDIYRWGDEGLGFPAPEIEAVAAQGFNIYLQLASWPGADAENIAALMIPLRELPPLSGLLFRDADLPGIPVNTALLAEELKKLDAPLVTVEFFDRQTPNLNRLARALDEKEILRLHAITKVEMEELAKNRIVQRFRLAAAERNNRLLLLRFGGEKLLGTTWLDYNTDIMSNVAATLVEARFVLGTPQPYTSLPFSRLSIMVLGTGVIAAAVLLLRRIGFTAPQATAAGIAALLLTAALLGLVGRFGGIDNIDLTRKGLALGATLIFPVLAVLTAKPYLGSYSLKQTLRAFALISAISLAGALLLAALLSDLLYMVKLAQFSGVKLALGLPPLVLLLYFSFTETRELEQKSATNPNLKPLWQRVSSFLEQPLVVSTALAAVILAVLLYIYLSRAGNESVFVSDLELRLRLLLDNILTVRPRTKEFLIGHPFMLLAIYFGFRFRGGPVLVALGAIGQVSLINSFAHLHTPILATLIRTFWGLALGILLGLLVLAVLKYLRIQVSGFSNKESG